MTTAAAPDLDHTGAFFHALADATRLRIVLLLAAGERCVCVIHDALDLPQPLVSRHLGVLRAAGIVAARRDGRWIHYRLATATDPIRAAVLRALRRTGRRAGPTKAIACER